MLATQTAVLDRLIERCRTAPVHSPEGVVSDVVGLIVEVGGLNAAVGDTLLIRDNSGARLDVEVVGFRGRSLLTTPLGPLVGIRPGARAVRLARIRIGRQVWSWPSGSLRRG